MALLTYRQWQQLATENLQPLYDAQEAQALSRQLLAEASGLPAHELATRAQNTPPPDVAKRLADWLRRLQTGEPLQYITGQAYCMGLVFTVTPAVLIPRPETEELIQWVAETVRQLPDARLLDVGTGSGCIAVALAKLLPQATLEAWDVSTEALAVAQANAARHKVKVTLRQVDVLRPVAVEATYNAIISNPPYIPPAEAPTLHRNVHDYEPHLALFTPGEDALVFYRRLAELGRQLLAPNGWLLVEVHAPLADQVVQLFSREGYTYITLRRDLQGRPRMVRAHRL